MISLALNTYLHLLFIITVFCCLIAELLLIKDSLSYKVVRKLSVIDGIYGIAAIMVVGTGLLNWFVFGKGPDYYSNNTLFIIKFSLFIVVGLLSILPTVVFARLKKRNREAQPETIPVTTHLLVRRVIILELFIMAFIPLLAELMANGMDI